MEVEGREVLLKALVGSHNYNLNHNGSDKDYKVFVMPTFKELYKGNQFSKQIIGETEDNDIHDIRKLPELLYKSNVNFLEVLFSNEIIIPDNDKEILEIYKLKEDIARINLTKLFYACRGMHLQKMALLNKGTNGTQHLVDKFGYDTKMALHAYRIMKIIVDYEKNGFTDFGSVLRYEGKDLDFMKSIRHGFFNEETFRNFISFFYESKFMKLDEAYKSQPINDDLKYKLNDLIMNLVKRRLGVVN